MKVYFVDVFLSCIFKYIYNKFLQHKLTTHIPCRLRTNCPKIIFTRLAQDSNYDTEDEGLRKVSRVLACLQLGGTTEATRDIYCLLVTLHNTACHVSATQGHTYTNKTLAISLCSNIEGLCFFLDDGCLNYNCQNNNTHEGLRCIFVYVCCH